MPQPAQPDGTVAITVAWQTDQTAPPASDSGPGGIGNPATLLLLLVAAGFLWWSMRRRRQFEQRLREQRHEETVANAELSARNVANIMRAAAAPPEEAAAAASEGLASAARPPLMERPVPASGEGFDEAEADAAARDEARARVIERAEAAALAERAAAEEAQRAARAAELAGESEARRLAAAAAAAEEARADNADALHLQAHAVSGAAPPRGQDQGAADALRVALRDLDNEPEVPLGAVAGDGTATCPSGFPIKGNAQSKIYHEPGQVSYPLTVAELCFASAEAAEAAGYRQSRARGQRAEE
jgi:hypothetical protein